MAAIVRVGLGYDLHRLEKERKLILGGIEIESDKGLVGHSDADVLLHAIIGVTVAENLQSHALRTFLPAIFGQALSAPSF